MKITHTMIVMFIGSFIIQYFFMPPIMIQKLSDFTNSTGKVYMSIIMGIFMVLLEVAMHDHQYEVVSTKYYITFGLLLIVFVTLYKTQQFISDKQYLEGMIEHHSMAILTSNKILEKTDNYNVAKLAKEIIQKQQDEIIIMKDLTNK